MVVSAQSVPFPKNVSLGKGGLVGGEGDGAGKPDWKGEDATREKGPTCRKSRGSRPRKASGKTRSSMGPKKRGENKIPSQRARDAAIDNDGCF